MKTRLFLSAVMFLFFIAGTGCAQEPGSQEITMKQFEKIYKEKPGTIVDVRTQSEVNKGVIPGSVNIDFFDDNFEKKISELDKTKPVYIYCASGGRSGESVAIFKRQGFKEIYDLSEGYGAYKKLHGN